MILNLDLGGIVLLKKIAWQACYKTLTLNPAFISQQNSDIYSHQWKNSLKFLIFTIRKVCLVPCLFWRVGMPGFMSLPWIGWVFLVPCPFWYAWSLASSVGGYAWSYGPIQGVGMPDTLLVHHLKPLKGRPSSLEGIPPGADI